MWKFLSALLLGLAFVACGDGGDPFSDAEVLSFAVKDEAAPSRIYASDRYIDVTVADEAALGHAQVSTLELSARATSDLAVGDVLDLTSAHDFTVTSEDSTVVKWRVRGHVAGDSTDGGAEGGAAGAGGAIGSDCDGSGVELWTYQLEGNFQITGTPLGAGDATRAVGPGQLVLRRSPDVDGKAAVHIVSYALTEKFTVDSTGAAVRTDNETKVETTTCGAASGTLEKGVVSWDSCDYGPAPPHGTNDWTPASIVGGPGCLAGYNVTGVVSCSGAFCGLSGVDFPLVLDQTYPQPLNSFELSSDGSTFDMNNLGAPEVIDGVTGVELPNEQPGRAWLSLHGTLIERSCTNVPSCPGD